MVSSSSRAYATLSRITRAIGDNPVASRNCRAADGAPEGKGAVRWNPLQRLVGFRARRKGGFGRVDAEGLGWLFHLELYGCHKKTDWRPLRIGSTCHSVEQRIRTLLQGSNPFNARSSQSQCDTLALFFGDELLYCPQVDVPRRCAACLDLVGCHL